MITKINSTEPSFKSTVIMTPRTVENFKRGLDKSLQKDLLRKLENLSNNGNNDTIYITASSWASDLEMDVAESINGVIYRAKSPRMTVHEIVNKPGKAFEITDIEKMYEALRKKLRPFRKNDVLAKYTKV